jgi:hypothetical protein
MNALNLRHWENDPFAARLFTSIKKSKRLAFIFWIICALHIVPFLYLKIIYPRDRIAPKSSPKVILWTPETAPSTVQTRMKFVQTFRDPSLLMLPEPYKINEIGAPPSSRLLQLEPSPSRLLSISTLISNIDGSPEVLSERANAALTPRPRRFLAIPSIHKASKIHQTGVIFAPSIQDRLTAPYPSLPRVSAQILNQTLPTQIRLAIDAQGMIRHALIVMSSGSDALDNQALEHIRQFRFTKLSETENQSLTWGEAKFFWAFDSSQQALDLPSDR